MENNKIIEQPVDLTTLTPRYTSKALSLLEEVATSRTANNVSKPFFMQVAYEEAHVPLFAAPDFQGVSRRGPYGDSVQQMDNSIGRSAMSYTVTLAFHCVAFFGRMRPPPQYTFLVTPRFSLRSSLVSWLQVKSWTSLWNSASMRTRM
jgi:hypothetical protein